MNRSSRQYEEMLAAASARLNGLDLRAIARRAELGEDAASGEIHFETLGRRVRLSPRDYRLSPPVDMWHHLSVLQYLAAADDARPGERWIALSDLPEGGLARGASFDREIDRLIAKGLSACPPEAIRTACVKSGATLLESRSADLSAVFHFMPRYPILLNLWYADDEFPAAGKALINASVSHILSTETAGTVCALLIQSLVDACR